MRDAAASDIVGNILMVALTVVGMAGVGAAVYALPGPDDPVHADLAVVGHRDVLKVRHLGGESFPVASASILLTVDGSRQDVPLGSFGLGETWQLGETVCLVGPTGCPTTWNGQTVTELRVVVDRRILSEWSGRVRR